MRLTVVPIVILSLLLVACSSTPTLEYVGPDPGSSAPAEASSEAAPAEAAPVGDACALLDAAFLNAALSSVESPFGGALEFQEPLQTSPSAYCAWKDPSIPAEVQLRLEDAATAELDDHSDRVYNIDVDTLVEPQDGPGEKAVIFVDTAFVGLGSEGLPYGYFFVKDELAVFLKVTFLDVGRDLLRDVVDEVDARIK